jgi:hypothetical protein
MPLVQDGNVRFIYSCDPFRLIDDQATTVSSCPTHLALDHLRGGSQAIPFESGWLAVTHEVALVGNGRVYLHRFIWLDETLTIRKITPAFWINSRGIEFVAGLAWHPDGERLIVSYGVRDAEAWLATLSALDVLAALRSCDDSAPPGIGLP